MADRITYYLDTIDKQFKLIHCNIETILGDLPDKNRALLIEFQGKVIALKQDFDEVSRELKTTESSVK